MHLQLGFRPVLVISSSELTKECLTTNDKAFASRPLLSVGKHAGYDFKMLDLAPYGSYWRSVRKLCRLQLFTAQRIESFKNIREGEISGLIRSLFESCQREISPVNIKSRLSDLTCNIMMRIVASKRFSPDLSPQDFQEVQYFKEMMEETVLLLGTFDIAHYLPFLKWVDPQGMSDNNDDVVKANALAIIIAGAETSYVTIEWALSALMQHPDVLCKAQQELDMHVGRDRLMEESDIPKLKYLQAIVKETLRLYPGAPLMIPHEACEDCTVGGYRVHAGTQLLVNVWAIQRDAAVWERPTEFDPKHFLKSGKEIDVKGQDFELIPFGSGRRMCPGMALAMIMINHTLGRLLQSFEWFVPEGTVIDMTEGLGLSLPKSIPLEAIIKPRLPLHLY
ncbi:hypothetical protein SUGI_0356060 [Cryptomeria japonica]|nr:hypothetical protein SUGI_0356060 [Cryptomeria japonica]